MSGRPVNESLLVRKGGGALGRENWSAAAARPQELICRLGIGEM